MRDPEAMDVIEIGPSDTAFVEAFVGVTNAVNEADSPWNHPDTVPDYTAILTHGWDGHPNPAFVGVDDGRVVAQGEYHTSTYENLDLVWLWVAVHPEHRRRGYGTAMMEHLLARARAVGKTSAGIDGWEGPRTEAFAARFGFEKKSQAINRRQTLADVDRDTLRKTYDEASTHAAAYELVRVEGPTPDDLLPAVAEMTAAINDAPLDDLELEDEVFTPERVREIEAATVARRRRWYRVLARHRESGELAGHTVVVVEMDRPAYGHQLDTSVVRAHRGHRLGLVLKADMMFWLADREPALETIDTWNAESNDHMIDVNEALGYRALGRGVQFQRAL
jgi:GNAT superfamily N-acetyltransferase